MRLALTRPPTADLANCELTFLPRSPVDVNRALEQHRDYEKTLSRLGVRVLTLDPEPGLPDAVFVEDAAVVLDEIAVATRPLPSRRRREVESVARALARHREVLSLEGPGTLEGGDVIRAGRTLYVGRSLRTDEAGIEELRRLIEPHGYGVVPVVFSTVAEAPRLRRLFFLRM